MDSLVALLVAAILASCCGPKDFKSPQRGVYYWKTTTTKIAKEPLQRNEISTMYMRFFDVVVKEDGSITPNATLQFTDSLPNCVDIVPVVFIVNDVMRGEISKLPELILNRIVQMGETNGLEPFREIQIDCDWTASTRESYFVFMKEMRQLCEKRGMKLSTTIRLHQLSQTPPPADRGVLMLYNTGRFNDIKDEKSILSYEVVKPYLKYLKNYQLPLSAAYPDFDYQLLFRRGHYAGTVDKYTTVLPGDSIVHRTTDMREVKRTKQAIENLKPEINHEIIIYDYENNDKNYSEIFAR